MEENSVKVIDKREQGTEITPQVENTFLSIFQIASQKGYDPAFIEKMMELREKEEAYQAKKAYTAAMAAFKKNAPEIEKDRKVRYNAGGKLVEYSHASLANVTRKVSSALGDHGLHAAWQTEQENGSIKVICTITHEAGHSESISLTAAPDQSGSKNSIQAIGSTISYLERYTLLALTGLATADMDDDGQSGETKYISKEQAKEIKDLIKKSETNESRFLEYLKVESIDKIPESKHKTALMSLEAKKKAQAKKIKCPDGKEVSLKDCEQCPKREGCPSHDGGES